MQNFFNQLWSRKNAIGLEIGASAIKIVELNPGSPPDLIKAVSTPTPSGTMQDGQVFEPKALAEEIRRLIREHDIKTKQVITTIPNQAAVTRNIFVPVMDRRELDESIKWEAERYLPYAVDDVVLDYDLLDNPKDVQNDTGQMEIVIAAAPKDIIYRYVEVLKLAGLEPIAIDVKPFAALRALRGSLMGSHLSKSTLTGGTYSEQGEVAVMLDIGASSTVIALVRGDRLLMTRNISIAADDFTTAVQKAFQLDFYSAENVKLQYGAATLPTEDNEDLLDIDTSNDTYSSAKVYDAIRPVLADLLTEIRRSLEFYRVQAGDIVIDRVCLSGGGAKLVGLSQAISDTLGLYVEVGNPWMVTNTKIAKIDPAYLKEFGPEFAVALGLAVRGVKGID
ncbi:type IV pilus assembly protein PilM [Deinococcus misasensis]|uniref:type IV pilus assembly protein PilM n=1 Tax=Deinococcus misasensis TaxID=392413 RepID=UPI0005564F0C|nr:type IV pilus assembly protein PilM [Deinococcus misasensis]